MAKDNFVIQLNEFLESKGLTQEQAHEYLEYVFIKAFERDKDALSRYEEADDMALADVKINLNLQKGTVDIERIKKVVEEKSIIGRFKEIEIDDPEIKDKNLKVGDEYIEVINLDEINLGKKQHIKQLFLQKLSEVEKIEIYKKFEKFKGELLNAKVHKILNHGNVILDYKGDSIFMPKNEISELDRPNMIVGNNITIYVLEINEVSKDAQIIASRNNPKFIEKLLEREINEISEGVVKIESISREPGFKTKVAVSSNVDEVDPVGTLIGFKGQKIKKIVEEINGERMDVIKYSPDLKTFISEALLPAELIGIKLSQNEEGWNEAVAIVEQNQFLSALGKRGVNIKLAAILTRCKIDVKTKEEAEKENISWEPITRAKFVSKNNNNFYEDIPLDDFASIEDISEITNDDYNIDDYEDSSSKDNIEDYENYEDYDLEKK